MGTGYPAIISKDKSSDKSIGHWDPVFGGRGGGLMVVIHSEANILLDGEEERGEGELIKKKENINLYLPVHVCQISMVFISCEHNIGQHRTAQGKSSRAKLQPKMIV